MRRVESELGPIDRVMNAAAIMPTERLLNQDADLINRIMAINYGGTVNVTMAVLPGMLRRGRGDLVNFASVAGWLPTLHFGAYNASKFAVVAFTEVLYHENRKTRRSLRVRLPAAGRDAAPRPGEVAAQDPDRAAADRAGAGARRDRARPRAREADGLPGPRRRRDRLAAPPPAGPHLVERAPGRGLLSQSSRTARGGEVHSPLSTSGFGR